MTKNMYILQAVRGLAFPITVHYAMLLLSLAFPLPKGLWRAYLLGISHPPEG
jgi:hypothetical protein